MRVLAFFVLLFSIVIGVLAVDQQKSVIFTFPDVTPDDVINRAKQELEQAGGVITHSYQLIRAFAAKAPAKAIQSVSTWSSSEYAATVEEDQIVTTQ